MLLVDQARTVLREGKSLKRWQASRARRCPDRCIWSDSHGWTVPATAYYPDAAPTFPKLEMYLHEAQTHQLLAHWTAANSIA